MRAKTAVAGVVLAAAVTAGCGGHKQADNSFTSPPAPVLGRPAQAKEAGRDLGFPGFATKNTTRVGGADPIADAAGVAQAVYPGAAADSKPGVVTIVDAADFQAAVSAGQLMASPLKSPILYSQDGKLPQASADALDAMGPTGADKAGKAQVIRIGDRAATPKGLKSTDVAGSDPAKIAAAIDRLSAAAAGSQSESVIVAGSGEPAF